MKAIDDGVSCAELAFGVKQFVDYFDQQGQFNYEIGKFSGEIYRYGKACVDFPKDVLTAAHGAMSLLGDTETLVETEKSQKRQLSSEKMPELIATAPVAPAPLNKVAQCAYCLSEHEFVQFFQGLYDGQKFFNHSLPALHI